MMTTTPRRRPFTRRGGCPSTASSAIFARCNLIPRLDSLRKVHFPADDSPIDDYNLARSPAHRRLIFEEFFWLSLALGLRRGEAVRSILPFHPTEAQKRALKEVVDDMTSDEPMNRLLQGDVGSGKTIVAVQAMIVAIEN